MRRGCSRQITGESKGQALDDGVGCRLTPNIVLSNADRADQPSGASYQLSVASSEGREILLRAESCLLRAASNNVDPFSGSWLGVIPGAAGNRCRRDAGL